MAKRKRLKKVGGDLEARKQNAIFCNTNIFLFDLFMFKVLRLWFFYYNIRTYLFL
jgi:hypothetical protein